MKVMVIGGGGREHAIIKKLKESKEITELYALPGNGGIAEDAVCVNIGATDIAAQVKFAIENKIDYAVVAPDDPLALGAVDALGVVYGPDGRPAAGLLNEKRTSLSCTLEEMFADIAPAENLFAGNTTLGVVVTNGMFDKTPLTKLAGMAHNGYARAIRPVHTTADGDSIYALSLGDVPGDINVVGAMAALAMERAILRAVQSAGSAYGLIGWEDLPR